MFTDDDPRNNQLLATLPLREFDRIGPDLKRVSLRTGQALHESGDMYEYVHFPTTALVTLLYLTESGMAVGVGIIGSEGVVGIEVFTGADAAPAMAIVQIAGIAYRMPAGAFRAKCAGQRAFQDSLLKYTQALITQVAQTAVCNRFHSIQQRYARWLLECSDRLDADRLAMTHERTGELMGVRREAISVAAHNLLLAGLIKIERGGVTILDRPGLEFAACECYKAVSAEVNRLLGVGNPRIKPSRALHAAM